MIMKWCMMTMHHKLKRSRWLIPISLVSHRKLLDQTKTRWTQVMPYIECKSSCTKLGLPKALVILIIKEMATTPNPFPVRSNQWAENLLWVTIGPWNLSHQVRKIDIKILWWIDMGLVKVHNYNQIKLCRGCSESSSLMMLNPETQEILECQ